MNDLENLQAPVLESAASLKAILEHQEEQTFTCDSGLSMLPIPDVLKVIIKKHFVADKYNHRLVEVVASLYERLHFNNEHPEELFNSDRFLSALTGKVRQIMFDSEERRQVLCNALTHVALTTFSEDKEEIFLRYLDELTSSHIRLLLLCYDPTEWKERYNVTAPEEGFGNVNWLARKFMEIHGISDDYLKLIEQDLVNRRLIENHSLRSAEENVAPYMLLEEGLPCYATIIGAEFCQFLTYTDERTEE